MLDSPDKLTDTESDSGVPQGTQPIQPNIKIDRKMTAYKRKHHSRAQKDVPLGPVSQNLLQP
jgi:hypothetical protein